MKSLAFLLMLLLIFAVVGGYMLHQRGLLTRETLDLFVRRRPKAEKETPAPVEPMVLSASIQKKQRELEEDTERLQELATRLELQRKELEAERAAVEKQVRILAPGYEGEPGKPSPGEEVRKLVKMYEGMPPEQAASILENLSSSVVARILLQMRGRQAAQIMAALSTNKAAEVSKLLVADQVEATR